MGFGFCHPPLPRSGFYVILEEIYCVFEDMRDLY